MEYIQKAFINYANFKGRANRKEFWYFLLFNFLFTILFRILNIPILTFIYSLIIIVPLLSLNVRRLHDVNMSGWWLLPMIIFGLIPQDIISEFFKTIGFIFVIPFLLYILFMFYLTIKKGDLLPNKYGI